MGALHSGSGNSFYRQVSGAKPEVPALPSRGHGVGLVLPNEHDVAVRLYVAVGQ